MQLCQVIFLGWLCASDHAALEPAEIINSFQPDARPILSFLKFHKVGSATVASILRRACPTYLPAGYWNYDRCKALPHGHESLAAFKQRGPAGMASCLRANGTSPVKLVTILRHPRSRVLSALHFFFGGRFGAWAKTAEEIATLCGVARASVLDCRRLLLHRCVPIVAPNGRAE